MSADSDSEPLVSKAADGSGASGSSGGGRRGRRHRRSDNMLPQRDRRPWPERMLVRLIATAGIVGIGVAISAIMVAKHSQGWEVGLVVSVVSVILAGILWSSRVL